MIIIYKNESRRKKNKNLEGFVKIVHQSNVPAPNDPNNSIEEYKESAVDPNEKIEEENSSSLHPKNEDESDKAQLTARKSERRFNEDYSNEKGIGYNNVNTNQDESDQNNKLHIKSVKGIDKCIHWGDYLVLFSSLFWFQFCLLLYTYVGKILVHLHLGQFFISAILSCGKVSFIYSLVIIIPNCFSDKVNKLCKKIFYAILTLCFVLPFILIFFIDPKFPFIQIEIYFLIIACLIGALVIILFKLLIECLCSCFKKKSRNKVTPLEYK